MATGTDKDKTGIAEKGAAAGKGPSLSRRAALRLSGIGLGAAVAAGAGVWRTESYPAVDEPIGRAFDYVTNKGKFRSPEFMASNRLVDSIPVFGSSELATSIDDIPQVPRGVFGRHDHGLDVWSVGEAGYQSLWHGVALAGYAAAIHGSQAPSGELAAGVFDARASNKAVFVISPQWFFPGGVWRDATQSHFSFHLWQEFCSSPYVTPAQVDYALARHLDRGVDATMVRAGAQRTLPDVANAVAFGFKEDREIRAALRYVLKDRPELPDDKSDPQCADGVPDWDALAAQALADAQASSTSNQFGFLDSFWESKLAADFDAGKIKDSKKGDNLLMAPEEEADLGLALDVARQADLDMLCVLLPWAGEWEDYRGFSKSMRDRRDELIRQEVSSHGFALADFSDKSYEPYFIFDGTHPGWLGWLAIEQAIYEFAMGE